MTAPLDYVLGLAPRRFAAGCVNCLLIGLFNVTAQVCAIEFASPENRRLCERLLRLGLVTAYWVGCAVMRKSIGATVCLLESRIKGRQRLPIGAALLRSLPFYSMGILGYFLLPTLFPGAVAELCAAAMISISLWLGMDAIILAMTGRTLEDRLLNVTVVELPMPHGGTPRLFDANQGTLRNCVIVVASSMFVTLAAAQLQWGTKEFGRNVAGYYLQLPTVFDDTPGQSPPASDESVAAPSLAGPTSADKSVEGWTGPRFAAARLPVQPWADDGRPSHPDKNRTVLFRDLNDVGPDDPDGPAKDDPWAGGDFSLSNTH